ncbi:MAG TPA: Gfo/Idh/MocA family oxidoreductase, partial [Burkholderiales bacterium]|nr:Gfo/Idh/MocA family oxidoreductase [Burkholderiales bacterium]
MSAGPKLAVNEHAPSRVRSGLIVGYGSIGERHLKNLRTIVPGIELTVVMQRPSVSSERVSLTADLEQALASKPSFAVIASPSYLHADQLLALLGAGVPCYIEKPVAVTLDQVRRLRAALELPAPPPITFAGCNLRFMPSLIKMKALLAQGAIGTPVRAHLQPWQWLPDWRPMREYTSGYSADAARGGGVMLDLIHEIDQARWLLGEFNQIAAVAAKASALAIDAE